MASVLLPTSVKPKKYVLHLEPNLETFKFKGIVTVDLDVVEPTNEIRFHAQELELHKVELTTGGKLLTAGADGVPAVELDKERQEGRFVLAEGQQLSGGPAKLRIEYTGIHNDNMVGFYRASYMRDGQKQWMVTTQFEPVGARQALPCWDEPAAKATFEVSLRVPAGLQGLSNMDEVGREKQEDGSEVVRFAESPVMSTYLLAFVVGEVECVSDKTSNGTLVNIYTTPGRKEQGRFALSVACKVITFFEDYFGIKYPLPKADLIAIPDFAMGAMENWGLITFRETALLVDEGSAPAATKQRVAYVISHELAHQWFGNLVTMQWWNDLWLNEGFATWVGWLGVDHIFPEWDVWTQFACNDMDTCLHTDALLGSHPVEVPINDPKEIEQVFDALSYSKGACVIRQLEAAIGADAFKKGLHSYLSKHAYANTITQDLWNSLAEASGKPVREMMASWTAQMGYPLLSILPPSPGKQGVRLRQTRFLSKGAPSEAEDTQLWWVPVTAMAGRVGGGESRKLETVVLAEKEGEAEGFVVPEGEGGWLRVNAGQTGIFRVNYTEEQWQGISAAVEALQLPVIDRLGSIMDAFALAKAGIIKTSQALQLAWAFKNETEYTVWAQMAGDINELEVLIGALQQKPLLEAVGMQLFTPIADKLGWEPKASESHLDSMLRPLVLGKLGSYQHAPTIAKCQELFKQLTADVSSVNPDLRRLVMSIAVKYGGKEEMEATKKLYGEAASPDFKIHCLVALSSVKNRDLYKEFLAFALDEAEVKAQDQYIVFMTMAGNADNREFAWDYFKEHYDTIHARFASAAALFKRIPALPLKGFATEDKARDAEAFFAAHPVPAAAMELDRTLETIRARAAWLTRDGDDMVAWLKSKAS
ncbi:hypothetical protein CLOM_g1545 [Closterium sp. NIES-68]|nr:hypothetical protein CLOM_g1545 [Closterium sp. NIES-68]GJP85937.1 hypothetical protein CLOP_g16026 [Closterium sp. NIES-67]